MVHKKIDLNQLSPLESLLTPTYAARGLVNPVSKYEMPETEMLPAIAYNLIHDELGLDGNSRLNLATFVTTWMEPEARQLMADTFDKNMIDKDEYPQTAEIELRCVNILSRLWNAPENAEATGCSTIGSSEAAMLGGMAMKWKWRKRRQIEGKSGDRPNLVMGINVQVCWEKFCRYWEVEPRFVPMEGDRYHISPDEAVKLIDENTIGVIGILGSTFDGSYEPIEALNDALEILNERTGWQVPLHVDAASGGFIAPFLDPDLRWDFRLPWVKSINTSGHKYGLVYPGVGWIIWRDKEELPEELIFHCSYLGGDLPNFALNFSRPGNQVVAQYYNFLRLGKEGYRKIQQACRDTALYLSSKIAQLGPFELLTDGGDIPVFAWKLKDDVLAHSCYTLYDMADKLRERGWLAPAYPMPKNRDDLVVQRIVVKEGFSRDMADILLADMERAIAYFVSQPDHKPKQGGSHFSH
ncbi:MULTISPECIES: glutamate decarboxylase [unclassified Synechocystis]|uniref:glutamate decarboxylase n=1 Tax=unclassified Synechocystis TaxID=2640012 RepID=UPI0004127A19|nr:MULTISPECIES: glutamate decarboxylase [unclassified Synechocystis]AIE75400.1 Glutamate decarboxylase [Synechocystis sp. PCC 6714]MCT0253629.1 glutamate decarboxylase [Synechocystis sp. CS-94]